MIKETFRYIEYSNEKKFNKTEEGQIELQAFTDDLLFAVNFDSTFDAIYASGSKEPESLVNSPLIANFDVFGFGMHGELNGTVIYDEESFRALTTEGSIKFYLKSGFNNAVGEQSFINANPVNTIPEVANYGVTLYDCDSNSTEFIIELEPGDDGLAIYNKLGAEITGNGFNIFRTNDIIRITTTTYGNEVFITSPISEDVLDLVELMGGVEEGFVPNAPSADVEFLKLSPKNSLENAITLTHGDDSHIYAKMYDNTGKLVVDEDLGMWSNVPQSYSAFEFNWNEQSGSLFIDGKLNKIFMTGVNREDCRTFLYLNGLSPDFHHMDELQIYDKVQHFKNYELATAPLTKYDSENPYIDIHYGQGFSESQIRDASVVGSDEGLHFCVKIGVTWYYYFNGSWRVGDGSFNNTCDIDTFEAQFENLYFNENSDLIIRVYFDSNGWTPVSFDEISIDRELGDEATAIVTGSIAITGTVDLSEDSMIEITTDQGTFEVDLSSAAQDTSAVTLEEIKQAIKDANVTGLGTVTDDGNGHLVLIGTTYGSEGYISVDDAVDGSALDIVWGGASSDTGEDDETTEGVYADYSELYRWVRSMLGYPLVPVELTDEQLEDALAECVYQYNKWRNYDENIVYAYLSGSPKNGWEIPAVVGGDKNITEIIMEPKYPTSYYAGRDDLYSNIFLQEMFGQDDITKTAADYHIALSTSRDLNMILNTEVRWEVINKRIFVTPIPSDSLKVAIKYKSALTLDEIVTSQPIRKLLLAYAKIVLGGIRSTFGNQVPGGDGMLQLNGSELKAEGTAERDSIIEGWKREIQMDAFIIG